MERQRSFPRTAFSDTSAFFALAVVRDASHHEAVAIQKHLVAQRVRLFSTNFVVAETYTLLRYRSSYAAAIEFLNRMRVSAIVIERVQPQDEQRAEEILRQYSDKAFSYVDAVSFAVIARLGIDAVFAFDADFVQYGLPRLLQ